MLVQLKTDNNIQGSAELVAHVEALVEDTFRWCGQRLTRVEVFLADENSDKKQGDDDKRCTMEGRLAGVQPITVTHTAATVDQALDGAAERLDQTFKRTLGRLTQAKGRTSYAGDQTLYDQPQET